MGKSIVNMIQNYVRKLSQNDLIWLYMRLHDRIGEDLAEVVQFLSKTQEMDRWLSTSCSATELYDMVDLVYEQVEKDDRLLVSTEAE